MRMNKQVGYEFLYNLDKACIFYTYWLKESSKQSHYIFHDNKSKFTFMPIISICYQLERN